MNKIVLDIETKNTFTQSTRNDPTALDISVLVIYDFTIDSYRSFLESDLPELWPIIENTDMIIGYNSEAFDIPLLNKYYPGDLTRIKSLDLMLEIKKILGKRLPLDMVAAGTLGKNKISHGLQAVTWWQQGEIEKIKRYCQEDVKITKEIYEYALANGHLKYKLVNELKQFPINTQGWEEKEDISINYTMPW